MCAAVCLLNTAPSEREWLEFTPSLPTRPQGHTDGQGNSLLQPVAMAAYFRDSSSEKNKRRKPKHFNGREEKWEGEKCRRVMRRMSESKKCIRSSLETGV